MSVQLFCATYDMDACLEQIKQCLEAGWTGMGYKTIEFENAWKNYTGLKNAYFTNSATAALNLAISVLKYKYDWDEKSEVITTPLTFISTNHAILRAGLKPVFADVDNTFCLDPLDVEAKITPHTKAVMFVGFGGNAGRYNDIVKICEKYGLKLILDAAHMAGTRVDGKIPGIEADAVVYSFQAVKNLPTADAGMVCMAEEDCDSLARKLAWLGINKDTYLRATEAGGYNWQYDVEYLGNKYNGNSIMAAIALAQLPHLDGDNEYRRKMSSLYVEGLSSIKEYLAFPRVYDNCIPSRHLFQILVSNRNGLVEYLNKKDIYPGVHYIPNTEYSMYRYAKNTCKSADYIGEHVLSLPMHMRITAADVQYVCECIKEYIQKSTNEKLLEPPSDWNVKNNSLFY